MHSETEAKILADVIRRPSGTAGDKFYALVSSSSRMPNSIVLERSTVAIICAFNEPVTNTGLDMSSKDSSKLTRPNRSSSDKPPHTDLVLTTLFIFLPLSIYIYVKGRKHGANKLSAQLPDSEFFNEREALRKEQEELKSKDDVFSWPFGQQELRKELAEKVERLDTRELKHLRRREKVLESRLETQSVPVETVNARKGPHGDVNVGILPGQEYARTSYKIAMSVPHENDPMTHAKPDTETTGPLITKLGPGPEFNVFLETLSAENDAAKDEIDQITRTKGALRSREKELEAQAKDRKKRVHEFNAPKSGRISSFASSMLLGSALTLGAVTMIMSAVGN